MTYAVELKIITGDQTVEMKWLTAVPNVETINQFHRSVALALEDHAQKRADASKQAGEIVFELGNPADCGCDERLSPGLEQPIAKP